MKKATFLVLSLLGYFVLFSGEIVKTYTFDNPQFNQIKGYTTIGFENLLLTGKAGEPVLPYQDLKLLLPPGHSAISIEFEGVDEITIPGYFELYPQQHSRPLSENSVGEFLKKQNVYTSGENYPLNHTGVLNTSFLNGHAIAMCTFTPLKYIPATGQVSYYRQVDIKITYAPSISAEAALQNLSSSANSIERVKNYVQNSDVLKHYEHESSKDDDYHLLIITPLQFADDFDPYINMYIERGIITELVTKEDIDASGTGQDLAEKIRNYIIQEYQDHNIEFVLLGGDVEHIPYRGFYCYAQSGSGYEDNNIPADLYYSALDGTWNDDNDNMWGEPGEDDLLPEVTVARFSFSNASELENMIHKTNMYQNEPVLGEFNDAVMAGEWLYNNPETWGSDYLELLIGYQNENGYETWGIPEDYTFHKLYESVGSWSANDLIAEINSGRQYVHHVGHANSNYVAYMNNSTITNSNFSGANGTDHNFTIFHSHGCICGAFDDSDCIMEKMHSIDNFAVAVVGNSRYGWFNEGQTEGPAAHLHREMVDAIYHHKMEHLGAAFVETKIQTAPWVTAPGQWEEGALRWNFYDINILGDPVMSLWTEEPIDIDVDHSGVLLTGVPTYEVTVTSGGQPLENFRCVILYEGEIKGVGLTDATGFAEIEVGVITPGGNTDLVVSGYNCLPESHNVTVAAPGLYVYCKSHMVNDELGNANGVIDFAESILLGVELENLGTSQVNSVYAELATTNPYITITDDYEDVGSIAASTIQLVEDAFSFDVSDDIPDQEIIEFEITIHWEGDDFAVNTFSEVANAPALAAGAISIDDSQGGNNNGLLDPGETAEITIEAINEGHCDCENALAEITSLNYYATVTNGSCSLGSMAAGETKMAQFTIEVNEDTPQGAAVGLDFELTSGAYSAQHMYSLPVGLVFEDFETGDFSQFEWSFGGNANWTVSPTGAYEGAYSAKSGTIGDEQETEMIITMDVISDGEISFFRKVSSEDNYDYLRFYINDQLQDEWAGEESWAEQAYPVSEGSNTFKWAYEKDYSVSGGSDCAWVDYIIFPGAGGTISGMEDQKDKNLKVYPNPSAGQFTLEFSGNTQAEVSVVNVLNEVIYEESIRPAHGNSHNIDLSGYPAGIYFILVKSSTSKTSKKIVIQ